MSRPYDMTGRAQAAERTRDRILTATEDLLATRPIDEVTLPAIAADAGVSVQTVLRHTGSRDGCFRLVAQRVQQRVGAQREASAPGDVRGALEGLMEHYEAEGRLVRNLLAQEPRDDFAAEAAATGRAYHRAWVQRCFGPRMRSSETTEVDALVAATDLSVWTLLREDLGRTPTEVAAVMTRLVDALLEDS